MNFFVILSKKGKIARYLSNLFHKWKKIKIIPKKWQQPAKMTINANAFVFGRKLKFTKKLLGILVFIVTFHFVGFFTPMLAAQAGDDEQVIFANGVVLSKKESQLINKELIIIQDETTTAEEDIVNAVFNSGLPASGEYEVINWGMHMLTAYNSDPYQTDDTPCITANGFDVCEHGIEDTVAANFLKFGAKVRIPDLFGDRIFIVRDRMNARYTNRIDVWMLNKEDAKEFGVRYARIEVITTD